MDPNMADEVLVERESQPPSSATLRSELDVVVVGQVLVNSSTQVYVSDGKENESQRSELSTSVDTSTVEPSPSQSVLLGDGARRSPPNQRLSSGLSSPGTQTRKSSKHYPGVSSPLAASRSQPSSHRSPPHSPTALRGLTPTSSALSALSSEYADATDMLITPPSQTDLSDVQQNIRNETASALQSEDQTATVQSKPLDKPKTENENSESFPSSTENTKAVASADRLDDSSKEQAQPTNDATPAKNESEVPKDQIQTIKFDRPVAGARRSITPTTEQEQAARAAAEGTLTRESSTQLHVTSSITSVATDATEETDSVAENQESQDGLLARNVENCWQMESPDVIAAMLFEGRGVKRMEVCYYLSRKTDYGIQVAEEYMKLFDFKGVPFDTALRQFFRTFFLEGETHDKSRVLDHFAQYYHRSNPDSFSSPDACLSMTFAVVLLNTDLHNPNVERRMSLNDFVRNSAGQNDGKDFPYGMLRDMYNNIKRQALPTPDPEEGGAGTPNSRDDASVFSVTSFMSLRRMSKLSLSDTGLFRSSSTYSLPLPARGQGDPRGDLEASLADNDADKPVVQDGMIRRKTLMVSEAKKAPMRGWASLFAQLKGSTLSFFKPAKSNPSSKLETRMCVRHSYSHPDATPRHPYLVHITTNSYRQYHLEADTEAAMLTWVKMLNQAAAMYSSPPLPAPISSQHSTFRWPPQSLALTNRQLGEQLAAFEEKIADLQENLKNELEFLGSGGGSSSSKKLTGNTRLDFFKYELQRYGAYCAELRELQGAGSERLRGLYHAPTRLAEAPHASSAPQAASRMLRVSTDPGQPAEPR